MSVTVMQLDTKVWSGLPSSSVLLREYFFFFLLLLLLLDTTRYSLYIPYTGTVV